MGCSTAVSHSLAFVDTTVSGELGVKGAVLISEVDFGVAERLKIPNLSIGGVCTVAPAFFSRLLSQSNFSPNRKKGKCCELNNGHSIGASLTRGRKV